MLPEAHREDAPRTVYRRSLQRQYPQKTGTRREPLGGGMKNNTNQEVTMKNRIIWVIAVLLATTSCNLPGRLDAYTTISNLIVSPSGRVGQFTLNILYNVVKVGTNAKIYCSYVTPDGTTASLGEYTPSGEGLSELEIPINVTQLGKYTVSCSTESESTPVTAIFTVEILTIAGNAGVGAATMIYTGGSSPADASGNYLIGVSSGWSGTITPILAGYNFDPASKSYTNVTSNKTGQDYTAIPSSEQSQAQPPGQPPRGTITYDEATEQLSPHNNQWGYFPSQHHKWCGIILTIDSAGNISGNCSSTGDKISPNLYGDWNGSATIEGTITGMAVPGGSFTFREELIEKYKPGTSFEYTRKVVFIGTGSFSPGSVMDATGTVTLDADCRTVDNYANICGDYPSLNDHFTGTIAWEFNGSASP